MPCNMKEYPHNWLTEIRPLILHRAGARPEERIEARCEFCHIENHSYRTNADRRDDKQTFIVLTISHLDQNIQNNDPQNLAALCQRCHLQHDRPHHLINASFTRDRKKKQGLFPFLSKKERKNAVSTKGPNHSYNVLLSPEHMELLKELADKTSTNKSIIIRQAITSYHAMKCLHIPTCADGQACRVPNMHIPPVQPQPQVPV